MEALISLRNALAEAYEMMEKRYNLCEAIGLSPGDIDIEGRANTAWESILRHVRDHDCFDHLITYLTHDDRAMIVPKVEAYQRYLLAAGNNTQTQEAIDNEWVDPNLPKLINRHRTKTRLQHWATENMKARLGMADAANAHFGFIVIGREDDEVDALFPRFTDYDSHTCWKNIETALNGHGGWAQSRIWRATDIIRVQAGDRFQSDSFKTDLKIATSNSLGESPLHHRYPDCALLVPTRARLGDSCDCAGEVTRLWLDEWAARLGADVKQPVMPVLSLIYDRPDQQRGGFLTRLFGGNDAGLYDQIKTDVQATLSSKPTGLLQVDVAAELPPLSKVDFNDWKDDYKLPALLGAEKTRQLIGLSNELFGNGDDEHEVRKHQFVEQIDAKGIFLE